ncbi:redox-regulated ATPase YchF [Alphaproteobacteria bacterium]|nr:redox-regulated ATPase YchF [Alphaproteobacteria bacterium]
MGFNCGIIGLPNVGKSTLFNALTESGKAKAANYPFATIEPNVGRVPVPDKRLQQLSKIGKSAKTTPTYIDFVDIAGLVKGASTGEGLGNKFLSHIREVDAIAHVVRCFEDTNITHVSSKINPISDIDIISTELKLADLEMLQNKIVSLKKKSKTGQKEIKTQIDLISDLQERLNKDETIKNLELNKESSFIYKSLNLITTKPMLYICNVDKKSVVDGNHFSNQVKKRVKKELGKTVIVSAAIESQIAEYSNENDKLELLKDIGLSETTLNKVVIAGYDILNLITYFTCGPKETRAWTIAANTTAPEAAGKIHTDFEKGFIRAETVSYNDYENFGGEVACRDAGRLRREGKEYIVKDGDVMHFLFNN